MTPGHAYALTATAEADLDDILTQSWRRFGAVQRDRYTDLLRASILRVADNPDRLGSGDHRELGPGIRAYPVWLAARRRSASSHILFYRREPGRVLILRILHEAMDPSRHLAPPDDPA